MSPEENRPRITTRPTKTPILSFLISVLERFLPLCCMRILLLILIFAGVSCKQPEKETLQPEQQVSIDTLPETTPEEPPKEVAVKPFDPPVIETGRTTPAELLAYAQSLTGVTYKYGSTDPQAGFDCSGFITHVFNRFDIAVPRSSVSFTNVEREVELSAAKPGDLILFTGTDSTTRIVGHMGIISSVDANGLSFIHSSSGKANGVTITPLNDYYMGRFMKVIRIFPQNDGA